MLSGAGRPTIDGFGALPRPACPRNATLGVNVLVRTRLLLAVMIAGSAGAAVALGPGAGPAMRVDSIGDTLYSFLAPARWPMGLAWDGASLWMSDNEEDSLYRLSTDGTVLGAFALPESINSPTGLTFIGPDLWLVDENTARLYVLDTATIQPRKILILPDTIHPDPTSNGLAWDGTHLWHSQYAWGRIFQLDTTDGSVVSSFAPPDSWIMGLEYDGQHLWGVSTQTDRAFVFSLPSGTVVNTYDWQVPYSLDMAYAGGYLWCASSKPPSGTRRIYKVDIGQGGVVEEGRTYHAERIPPGGTVVSGVLNLTADASNLTTDIILLDAAGRKVMSLRPGANDVARLAPGVYYVRDQRPGAGVQGARERVVIAR